MSKSYVIQWKSRINGRSGQGTNRFELEDAELLAEELNREYPGIHHEVTESNLVEPTGSPTGPPEVQPEPASEAREITHSPDSAMAF